MIEILQTLKKHGERLDSGIAKEIGMPLATVRQHVAGLAATGAVITCNLTRFEKATGSTRGSAACRVHSAGSARSKPKPTT
jgi:predicted ArsR family transcriptional regulator